MTFNCICDLYVKFLFLLDGVSEVGDVLALLLLLLLRLLLITYATGVEPRASCILGKHAATELHPQLTSILFYE